MVVLVQKVHAFQAESAKIGTKNLGKLVVFKLATALKVQPPWRWLINQLQKAKFAICLGETEARLKTRWKQEGSI